jgi:hypothetical protein
MKIALNHRSALSLFALAAIFTTCAPGFSAPLNKPLTGRVTEEGKKEKGPGLSRQDLDPSNDPFSDGQDDQVLEAPKEAFQMQAPPKPPKRPFGLNAEQQGNAPLQTMVPKPSNGNPFEGEGENLPPMPIPQQPPPSRVMQNDPDSSAEMQLAWDMWHKRVAEAIYTRFNFLAKVAFRRSSPLLCKISYVVTRDGQIQNIQIQEKATNVLFNVIVFQTVKSLNGDIALLQFPQGSRRMYVPKNGTFTQNYGNDGFKYTTGDMERYRQQR